MPEPAPLSAVYQRANGRASVGLSARLGRIRLDGLAQKGCAKVFLPNVAGPPEVVFLNTAGGLTGGDRLDYGLTLGPGVEATGTTQTAERAYAATEASDPAHLTVEADVGAGAHLDWLPQETILFDKARLERTTRISLDRSASLLFCEALVLGRAAMGEQVDDLWLKDHRTILRDGRPVILEPVALSSEVLRTRAARAGLAGARALATVGLVSDGAEDAVASLRDVPIPEGVRMGVSGWDGRCLVRLMAMDGWPLRLAVAAIVRHVRARNGKAGSLPRVWQI